MTKDAVSRARCRWGFQNVNEKSWYRGNQALVALGKYIIGSGFRLTPIRGNRVPDDTPSPSYRSRPL